jgi:hypothetical protein
MKIEWWKLARRGAMAAIVACCVVGLTGCDDDDGGQSGIDEIWVINGEATGKHDSQAQLNLADMSYTSEDCSMGCSGNIYYWDVAAGALSAKFGNDTEWATLSGTISGGTCSGTFTKAWPDGYSYSGTFSGVRQ